jgi:hypothetical protein
VDDGLFAAELDFARPYARYSLDSLANVAGTISAVHPGDRNFEGVFLGFLKVVF